ncbi:MAG: hypothetical protein ACO2PN_20750 [Pyrobaculum sp.]
MAVGFAFFIVPNTTLILLSVTPARRGAASALVAETRVVGQSLSNTVAAEKLLRLTQRRVCSSPPLR